MKRNRLPRLILEGLVLLVLLFTISEYKYKYTMYKHLYYYEFDASNFLVIQNFRYKDSINILTNNIDSLNQIINVISVRKREYREVEIYKFEGTGPIEVDTLNIPNDSIYNYSLDLDTVKYELKIKAEKLFWYDLSFSVTDNVGFKKSTPIEYKTEYVYLQKPKTWKDWIYLGPTVGYGYTQKGFGWYVGLSLGIDLIH